MVRAEGMKGREQPPSVSRGVCSWARCLVACAMCQRWASLDGSCSDLAHEACAQSRPRRDRRRRWPTRCLRAGRRCAPRPSPSGLFGKCGGWTGEGEEGEIRGEIVEEGVNRLSTQPCQLVSLLLVRECGLKCCSSGSTARGRCREKSRTA